MGAESAATQEIKSIRAKGVVQVQNSLILLPPAGNVLNFALVVVVDANHHGAQRKVQAVFWRSQEGLLYKIMRFWTLLWI